MIQPLSALCTLNGATCAYRRATPSMKGPAVGPCGQGGAPALSPEKLSPPEPNLPWKPRLVVGLE